MKIIYFKSFVVLAVMFFCGLANADTNDSREFTEFTNEASSAIGSEDVDLIASITANAIDKNPEMSKEIIDFIFSNYPAALPNIVNAVQSVSPDNAPNVLTLVTGVIEECARNDDDLANCPNDDLLIARILSAVNPAAGGEGSNNIPDFVLNQGLNPGGIQLPDAVTENPNVISGN